MTLTHSWKKRVFEEADAELKPEARIRRQVDGIERLLGLKFRARVLDLGCGAGSQTIELARRKYRVVGMDASPAALASAREKARAESLTVHFQAQDMRRIPWEDEFNAVLNLRNPIGLYTTEREDLRCLEAVQRALRLGGKLLLDLLNREWLIRRLGPATRAEAKEQAFDLRMGLLDTRGFAARGDAPGAGGTLRLYSLTELIRMLRDAGLAFREVYGGYDGRVYGVDSLRMILVAEKTAESDSERRRGADEPPGAIRIKGRPR